MRLGDFFVCTTLLEGGPHLDKAGLVARLLTLLVQAGRLPAAALPGVLDTVLRREQLCSTGIGRGLAVPHGKHPSVPRGLGVLAVCRTPMEYDSLDREPVDIVALILAPPGRVGDHLGQSGRESGELFRRLDAEFCTRLRQVGSAEELADLVQADGGMTRRQWLSCNDPRPMLRFLLGLRPDQLRVQDVESFPFCKGSDRKLRLFACACYWRMGHLLPNALAREAIGVAERFADGQATAEELEQVDARVGAYLNAMEGRWRAAQGAERWALQPTHDALALAGQVADPLAPKGAYYASSNAYHAAAAIANPGAPEHDAGFSACRRAEERAQADLLRCVFGPLPFGLLSFSPSWRTPDVLAIAGQAYQRRDFAELGVLADALEEAGATNADLLVHLRGKGPHCRGCHALDLALGFA